MLGADTDIWRYQAHPEVWLIIGVVLAFGWYVQNVLAPKAVPAGEQAITRRHKISFGLAVLLLWLSSDWPVHDISEEYLYFVHMAQHLMITLIIPPLFLLATPEWLARLIVSQDGTSGIWVRRLTRPVPAALLFNVLVALTHIKWVVNTSIENGVFHYAVHLVVFAAALLMWMPVASPLPELRASYPGQMLFLFLNSVLPTVPGGFLTFAEGPLYRVYDHDVRLWGVSVTDDQQAAGLIMKLGGGFFIWSLIAFLFFRWVSSQQAGWRPATPTNVSTTLPTAEPNDPGGTDVLTFDEVQRAFDAAGTPKPEDVSDLG
ncbi:MAG: cytochrome c oxidase assembly protein [Actinomycetota bacterium]